MADRVETNDGGRVESCRAPLAKSTPPMTFPAVVACGYRQVRIPKSGNSFPAFLVAFPNDDPIDYVEVPKTHGGKIRFAWRTKRDFMLLARSTSESFPKAALKKVVEDNAVPWRRSTFTNSDDDDENQTMDFDVHNIPYYLTDPKLPNRFTPRMKKSLWQVDRFLQGIQTAKSTNDPENKAWGVFCRPSDSEDLVTAKEFTRTIATQNTNKEDNERNESNTPFTSNYDENTTTLRESSRLGQYFASEENSRKVVECVLEKILPLHRDMGNDNDILFVEPSCGHGDIIIALIEALKRHKIPPRSVFVQGYDIDPCAIKICRQRQEFPLSTKYYATSSLKENVDDQDYRILWDCTSFFETTRQNCLRGFYSAYNRRDTSRGLLVCCLGGPPYTTGQGSGSMIERDLPTRFVQHCRNEWKADVIAFLLPERYREGMQHNIADCTFTKRAAISSAESEGGTTNYGNKLICETEELNASTFFFRGTTQVTQPSVIQTFYSYR